MQSSLIEEASAAIYAAEAEAQQGHQELLNLKHEHQKEVDSAVSRAVGQYKAQLISARQPAEHKHKLESQKLQKKIHSLEVSLANKKNSQFTFSGSIPSMERYCPSGGGFQPHPRDGQSALQC